MIASAVKNCKLGRDCTLPNQLKCDSCISRQLQCEVTDVHSLTCKACATIKTRCTFQEQSPCGSCVANQRTCKPSWWGGRLYTCPSHLEERRIMNLQGIGMLHPGQNRGLPYILSSSETDSESDFPDGYTENLDSEMEQDREWPPLVRVSQVTTATLHQSVLGKRKRSPEPVAPSQVPGPNNQWVQAKTSLRLPLVGASTSSAAQTHLLPPLATSEPRFSFPLAPKTARNPPLDWIDVLLKEARPSQAPPPKPSPGPSPKRRRSNQKQTLVKQKRTATTSKQGAKGIRKARGVQSLEEKCDRCRRLNKYCGPEHGNRPQDTASCIPCVWNKTSCSWPVSVTNPQTRREGAEDEKEESCNACRRFNRVCTRNRCSACGLAGVTCRFTPMETSTGDGDLSSVLRRDDASLDQMSNISSAEEAEEGDEGWMGFKLDSSRKGGGVEEEVAT
ncbi:hypothetical protein BT69DRAFT_1095914 [Atractiella rhizophila]|nr:hypothetical protein BT69DRAFT_1095914 [Atractiella rhizophila]